MTNALGISRETKIWSPIITLDILKPELSLCNKRHDLNVERIQLRDICRQATAQHLVPCVIDGLKSEGRESPDLLLWNDRGLSPFDAVLDSPDYYPEKREWSLLRYSAQKIANAISLGDRLTELGARQARHKHVQYIVYDVDRTGLIRDSETPGNVFVSSPKYQNSRSGRDVRGLRCLAEMKRQHQQQFSYIVVWLSNSMANFTPKEASEHIRIFPSSGASMIVALDGCPDWEQIARPYEGEPNREFVLNGLSNPNELFVY